MKHSIFSDSNAVPIDKFMREALYDRTRGYYMTHVPFGLSGDFITSPDISQLFGETIAIWLLQYLEYVKLSERCILVELGPGRGTLMSDILRILSCFPQYDSLLEVHLVEISPLLRNMQKETLKEAMLRKKIFWHDSVYDLPECTTILIANEFFDALPIKQFVFHDGMWFENYVCSGTEGLDIIPVKSTNFIFPDNNVPDGGVIEICEAATDIIRNIEGVLLKHGGTALIVDYGYMHPVYKSTIQAVRNHQYCSFLDHIGESDISASVDFVMLQKSLKEIKCEAMTQREFLYRFGIRERLEFLMQRAQAKQAEDLKCGFLRLTENMGTLFKVLLLNYI
ncbi:hypothetical protein ANAPRD1_00023 [Anaplasma phagocytophilum]|uniref:class I SAM-dependent methyltransferase n=1 Tax=Anaplasma phagocytophilum TaxID=948 RepID=UPI0007DF7E47|nr:SAM-dependent methyltransferase [Anaplasma phagocytophilum]SCV61585.1 hypothetical protein ANAPRD1_00023 [Anaplasma phagocytophilum]